MRHLLHSWILSFVLAAQLTASVAKSLPHHARVASSMPTSYILEASGDAHFAAHEDEKPSGAVVMRKLHRREVPALKSAVLGTATLQADPTTTGVPPDSSKEAVGLMRRVPKPNTSKDMMQQVTQNSSLPPLAQASHFLNIPEGSEGFELHTLLRDAWRNGTALGLLRLADDRYGELFGIPLVNLPQAVMPLLFLCSSALMASMVHSRSSITAKEPPAADVSVERRRDTLQDTDRVFSSCFLMVLVLALSFTGPLDSQVPCLFALLGYFLGVRVGRSPKSLKSLQRDGFVCTLASFAFVLMMTLTPVANQLLLSRLPWLVFFPLACCIAFMPGLLDCLPDASCSPAFTAVSLLWIWMVSYKGALVTSDSKQHWSIFVLMYGLPSCMHLPEFAIGLLMGRRFPAHAGERRKVVCLIGALGGAALLILLPRQVAWLSRYGVFKTWLTGGFLAPLLSITSFCLDEVADSFKHLWASIAASKTSAMISTLPIAAPIFMASQLRNTGLDYMPGARVQGTLLMFSLCCAVEWVAIFASRATCDKDVPESPSAAAAQKGPYASRSADEKAGSVMIGKFKKPSAYAVSSTSFIILLFLYWFVFVLQIAVFSSSYSYGLTYLQAKLELTFLEELRTLFTPFRNLLPDGNSSTWHYALICWSIVCCVCFLIFPIVPLTFDLIGQLRFPAVERRPVHTMPRLLARARKQEDFVMHFRYCTRGTNRQLVNDNLKLAKAVMFESGLPESRWCLEVITDNAIVSPGHGDQVSEVVVPESYVCPNGGKYKARALHYAIDARFKVPTGDQDWIIHLDEETQFDIHTVCAMYRHCQREHAAVASGRKKLGNIGQGIIVYNYGTVPDCQLAGLADVCRVSGDFGKFRLSYELGRPIIGMHGSFVVCSQAVERLVGFDAGIAGSVTEDTYFALKAWGQVDARWSFIDGFMFEQSPFGALDFMKQRGRWFHGMYLTCTSTEIPLRCRVFLGLFLFFNAWIQSTMWILFPVGVAWDSLGVSIPEQVSFSLSQMRTLVNWGFLLGFCMSMTPYTGWARWLVQLWMTLTLQFCFALLELGGVIVGIGLILTKSEEFHIVQKERPEGTSATSPTNARGTGAGWTSASSTGDAASLLQKRRSSKQSPQAPIQADDMSSDSDELETDKDLADAAAGPPRDQSGERAAKGKLWTGFVRCARQLGCATAAFFLVRFLLKCIPPPANP
mmetsp:Transcript_154263/g.268739  ORF Transcript_154263/g.268739 Transcript_154263/m.268739 type:complete len:1199 (-) Transcript_154263:119-3715(-)